MSTSDIILQANANQENRVRTIRVWDPFVRLFHWSLVALFVFAFATGDEWDAAHEMAGFAIAGLVFARIIWGFAGSRHARFSDFVHRPSTILAYLRDSVLLKARRYIGHNPAGGAMVIALLAMIAAIAGSGYAMTTDMFWGVDWVEELHEATVYSTLVLIALHVAGVIFASLEHRENLVKAMFTGKKRAD